MILKYNDNRDIVPAAKLLIIAGRSRTSLYRELDDKAIIEYHSLSVYSH